MPNSASFASFIQNAAIYASFILFSNPLLCFNIFYRERRKETMEKVPMSTWMFIAIPSLLTYVAAIYYYVCFKDR